MKIERKNRQQVMSFKVTAEVRSLVERLAAYLTLRNGQRTTLTDVVETGIRLLAKREGVAEKPKEL